MLRREYAISVKNCTPCWRWSCLCLMACSPVKTEKREIVTVLELLEELVPSATPAVQGQLQMLAKQVRLALPQTLLFARRLDAVQEQASRVLGAQAVALLAWAWLRRAVLCPTSEDLLQSIHPAWPTVASHLLAAWDQAVRASSALENWHRLGRRHL